MIEHAAPANIIALLTDFGLRDHYTGALRGAILSIDPSAVLADITHDTSPYDIRSAGFSLWACYKDFPAGTVFLCVVDPGVGSKRRRIIVRTGEYQFVAPDNGLLSFILNGERSCNTFEIVNADFFGPQVTGTFDGRDIFGPVAAYLAKGIPAETIGLPIDDPVVMKTGLEVVSKGLQRLSEVICVDRFGNLVTGLDFSLLVKGAEAEISGFRIGEIRKQFSEGPTGTPFLIGGSSRLIEIASTQSSASDLLSAGLGDAVVLYLPEDHFSQ
jgi:S-adenosylmethionine hydrolase